MEIHVANVLDCDIVVSKFELQSHYYTHFRTNAIRKGMTSPPIIFSYELDSTAIDFLLLLLSHWITHLSWYAIKQTKPIT